MNKATHGFSLIELIIVLGIITLLAAITLPCLTFFNKQLLKADVQQLGMTIAHLRQCALIENKKYVLTIHVDENCYRYNNQSISLTHNVRFGVLPHAYGPPSAATVPLQKATSFENNQITFYPNGSISSGVIYMVDSSLKNMYAISIGVAQVPFIRTYNYHSKRWILIA